MGKNCAERSTSGARHAPDRTRAAHDMRRAARRSARLRQPASATAMRHPARRAAACAPRTARADHMHATAAQRGPELACSRTKRRAGKQRPDSHPTTTGRRPSEHRRQAGRLANTAESGAVMSPTPAGPHSSAQTYRTRAALRHAPAGRWTHAPADPLCRNDERQHRAGGRLAVNSRRQAQVEVPPANTHDTPEQGRTCDPPTPRA
uniref:Uncharacterized protein n=1 Tax=Knipowitschia caucasica TaxID=637954 RepID=A0AAV2JUD9_KNICA